MAKLIPSRGAWLEFETSRRDLISVKVDRKRKLPVTTLFRTIGYSTDDEIYELFQNVDTMPDHPYLAATIEKEPMTHAVARRCTARVLQEAAPRRPAHARQRQDVHA